MRPLYVWLVFCSAIVLVSLHHRARHPLQFVPKDTLVVYLYQPSDPQHKENLLHFLNTAVRGDDKCQYVILIAAGIDTELLPADWPKLPGSAQYVVQPAADPPRTCSEWGMLGWFLDQANQQNYLERFQYFVFVSSTVLGPFLPVYLQSSMHWTHPFTSRLSHTVKLVGPTISCEGAPAGGKVDGTWRRNPHIPMSAMATDSVGLQVLLSPPEVLACHANQWDTRYYSEVGASAAILDAGYTIDSLMIRYQGVDWRNSATWDCNKRWDPTLMGDFPNDGVSPGPMELVFVPVNSHSLSVAQPAAVAAQRYASWQEQALAPTRKPEDVAANRYAANRAKYKLARVLTALVYGADCFDVNYFVQHNPDFVRNMQGTITTPRVFAFFVYYGQFEDRPFRYTCPPDWNRIATPSF